MSAEDQGYLFGCCAACRALVEPTSMEMMYPESQSWAYLMARVQEVAQKNNSNSRLTDKKQMSHLVARAKYSMALSFAMQLDSARLNRSLPNWNANVKSIKYTGKFGEIFCSNLAVSRTPKAVKNAATGEHDEEMKKAIEEARAEAEGAPDADAFASIILDRVSSVSDALYYATWDKPRTDVAHARLSQWVSRDTLRDVSVDLDRTTACCRLCNNIWDCFARIRATFEDPSVAPNKAVATKEGTKNPVLLPADNSAAAMLSKLGCLVAYYLHASLGSVGAAPANLTAPKRPALVMMLWLPMHLNAMYRESLQPVASPNNPKKGFHNYVGCLELLAGYYLWICGCADPDLGFDNVPFERFHVFYVKEMSEAPAGVWDGAAHPRLHDFLFGAGYSKSGTYASQISHVSDRLQLLYHDVLKPLWIAMQPPAGPSAAQDFFITHDEADALTKDYLRLAAENFESTRLHLGRAGIHAITWQLRRALAEEAGDRFAGELDRWSNARMQVEWRNMASRLGASDWPVADAQLIYYAQHTLRPPERRQLLALAASDDPEDDAEGLTGAALQLKKLGLCSPWKAAARLRKWGFSSAPLDEEDDEDTAGLSAGMARLTMQPKQRLAIATAWPTATHSAQRLAITSAWPTATHSAQRPSITSAWPTITHSAQRPSITTASPTAARGRASTARTSAAAPETLGLQAAWAEARRASSAAGGAARREARRSTA